MKRALHVYYHVVIRRPHRIMGALFIGAWVAYKTCGDLDIKYDHGFWASNAISAYFIADMSLLVGIRLFLGVPFFHFSDLRDFYHWCRRKLDAIRWNS
jgi:hypothetical protein